MSEWYATAASEGGSRRRRKSVACDMHKARAGSADVHVETRHSFDLRSKSIDDSEFGSVSKVYFSVCKGAIEK